MVFTTKKSIVIMCFIWTVCGFVFLFPTIGIGLADTIYIPHLENCLPDFKSSIAFTSFLVVFVFIAPTLIIMISFVCLYRIAFHQNTRVCQENTGYQLQKVQSKIVLMLVVMTVGFYIMWTPFVLSRIYEIVANSILDAHMDRITCYFAIANSAVNPILYIPTNKPYREEVRKMLKK